MRSRWLPRRVGVLAVAPLLALGAVPATSATATVTTPDVVQVALPADTADVLTLVTGDRVILEPAADGRFTIEVEAAPRVVGPEPEFDIIEDGDDLYVFPSDAASMMPERLDHELFNVRKLIDYGYTEGVPVIVTGAGMFTMAMTSGISDTTRLSSIDGYAGMVAPDGGWWASMTPHRQIAGLSMFGGGFDKVWLDEIAEVVLDESTPMTGAPHAWADGYDGTGMTVAVLDTGIDPDHPDVADRIVGAENFTSESDTIDGHGHGTHVAATVLGTGDGSDGTYTGVAPGADLLVGKICTSSGNCPNSASIAGMEWAASRADVINLSIGSNSGAGADAPTALAVDRLAEQHDALFVISAGNNGTQGPGSIGSPGSANAALTVGAVNKDGQLAAFSSTGPRLGDFAIKPDITGPGVGIVAARADGTSMGTPVDELYTAANGTSMSAPHVAGAAAILRQRHPDLSAAQAKAILSGTATPHSELTIYEQGGGLVDIPAALEATVVANPSPLDLGFFAHPHDQADPVQEEITYTNLSDQDLTLDLVLQVTDADGVEVPTSALELAQDVVTVAAGGQATVAIDLDVVGLQVGSYGGYLTASSDDGNELRTPVGFHLEQEMYELTIEATTRDGSPAVRGSTMRIRHAVNADVFSNLNLPFEEDGTATVRVPPGPYFVAGSLTTYDGNGVTPQDRVFFGTPTVEVTEDTHLVYDARDAVEITFDAPAHPQSSQYNQIGPTGFHFGTEAGQNWVLTNVGSWRPTYVIPAGTASVGNFEFFSYTRLTDPPLALKVTEPIATDLYPQQLSGSPVLDESLELPLVFAGQGAEADYDGVDATGKAVLVERDGPELADKEAIARAHGAQALVVLNNTTGFFTGSVGSAAEIVSMSIPGEQGHELRDLLDAGEVTVEVSGTILPSYLYDVAINDPGFPADPHYVLERDEMATVKNWFYGPAGQDLGESRVGWRPYMLGAPTSRAPVPAGTERIEYVTADDTLRRQAVAGDAPSRGLMQERDRYHEAGEYLERTWFKGPQRTTLLEPYAERNPGDPVERTGDTIRFVVPEWADSNSPIHYGQRYSTTDTQAFRAYQDGTQFGSAARPRVSLTNLAPGEHTYRLEVDVARDAEWWPTSISGHTAWTVKSARPEDGATEVLPLLMLDYDTELDLHNTALHPSERRGPATLDLQVRHQDGAEANAIDSVTVEVSYDDGDTWRTRPVQAQGDGEYRAILDQRGPADTSGFISLRVAVWDVEGNGIEQEVIRAWRLADR